MVELGPSTNSKQSWAQVDRWIHECRTHHRRCRRHSRSENPLPTRLLDIGEIDPEDWSVGRMRLVETKDAGIKEPYVTVSHKWGTTHKFIESTKENREKMMNEGFPMSDEGLTQNFREAISVARRLQKRYIWIDSICILQGDPNDFANEAPLMHQYYRYSFCNIAAADADEPSDGLFRERCSEDPQFPVSLARYVPSAKNKMMGRSTWVVIPLDMWEEQLLQNPLYSRGWVFQGQLPAPFSVVLTLSLLTHKQSECWLLASSTTRATNFSSSVPPSLLAKRYLQGFLGQVVLEQPLIAIGVSVCNTVFPQANGPLLELQTFQLRISGVPQSTLILDAT